MEGNQTESPSRTFGRRFAVGVARVLGLPGRVAVAVADVGQRAAEACLVPTLLATVIGIWLVVCWCAAAGDLP